MMDLWEDFIALIKGLLRERERESSSSSVSMVS